MEGAMDDEKMVDVLFDLEDVDIDKTYPWYPFLGVIAIMVIAISFLA